MIRYTKENRSNPYRYRMKRYKFRKLNIFFNKQEIQRTDAEHANQRWKNEYSGDKMTRTDSRFGLFNIACWSNEIKIKEC